MRPVKKVVTLLAGVLFIIGVNAMTVRLPPRAEPPTVETGDVTPGDEATTDSVEMQDTPEQLDQKLDRFDILRAGPGLFENMPKDPHFEIRDAVDKLKYLQRRWKNRVELMVDEILEQDSALRRHTLDLKASIWRLQHDMYLDGTTFEGSWKDAGGYLQNAEALMREQKKAIMIFKRDTDDSAQAGGGVRNSDWNEIFSFRSQAVKEFYYEYCRTPWPNPQDDKKAAPRPGGKRLYWCDALKS